MSTYITAVPVSDLFADHTYQRELDERRTAKMAREWAPELVGVLDVSDRGENASPRYALINGQHRAAAARLVDETMSLPVTVHTGLSVEEEATLFWDIDRKTKRLGTWDKWYARRAAGDPVVVDVENVAAAHGYTLSHNQTDTTLQCCAALEWVADRCSLEILDEVLGMLGTLWPDDYAARKSPIIKGLAIAIDDYVCDLDRARLTRALQQITPAQLHARAHGLKSQGYTQGLAHLVAVVVITAYNRQSRQRPAVAS